MGWKVICPPENWQEPIPLAEGNDINILAEIAKRLDLRYTVDHDQGKIYIGLHEMDKPAVTQPLPAATQPLPAVTQKLEEVRKLVFTMDLPTSPQRELVVGAVKYFHRLGDQMLEAMSWRATSGLPGFQVYGRYWSAHTPLPPSSVINRLYRIPTQGYLLSTRGIAEDSGKPDMFFHLQPDPVVNPENGSEERSEAGMHHDSNAPGTNACIGFESMQEWLNFKTVMADLHSHGIMWIDVEVVYPEPQKARKLG